MNICVCFCTAQQWSIYHLQNRDLDRISHRPIRGRPLMIWGGRRKFLKWHFFPRNPFRIFFFEVASQEFFFLEKGLWKYFFLNFLHQPQIINGRPVSRVSAVGSAQTQNSSSYSDIGLESVSLNLMGIPCPCLHYNSTKNTALTIYSKSVDIHALNNTIACISRHLFLG